MIGSISVDEGLPNRIILVGDANTAELFAEKAMTSLENSGFKTDLLRIPPGEGVKTLETTAHLYDRLHSLQISRDSALFALGGGVVGDLAGFVAATYMRGLPLVQVPTTLLAQVDSSVGGKVGVNLPYGKNLIGAFYQPAFVFIDVQTLKTLPARELRSGLAEVVKYGAILDNAFLKGLRRSMNALLKPDLELYPGIINSCCSYKAGVVARDEKEGGYREILNFGHTVGHALESLTGYETLTHGEAITYGMITEIFLSVSVSSLPESDAGWMVELLQNLEPPPLPSRLTPEEIFTSMFGDKKVRGGRLRFTLLERPGHAVTGITPDEAAVKSSLDAMLKFSTRT